MHTPKGKSKKRQQKKYGRGKLHPNAAGIDLGSRSHYVALPPGRAKDARDTVKEFLCYTGSVQHLVRWLQQHRITSTAMEATGVFWMHVYTALENAGIEVVLVNAQHYHNAPGRKTDVKDCQWLQELHEKGMLAGSFVPPPNILEIRTLIRQRETKQSSASQHILRMQKHMEQMNFQLHKVLDDITGQTGMAIIRDLVGGQTDASLLARHRHPGCKAPVAEFIEAMTGDLQPQHLFCLKQELASFDACQRQIAECDENLKSLWTELAKQSGADAPALPAAKDPRDDQEMRGLLFSTLHVDLTKIPGFSTHNVSKLLAEIGTDISKWPTAAHFASWCQTAPRRGKTGGKWMRAKGQKSSGRVRQIFLMAAFSLANSSTALGAYFRRRRAQRGPAFAAAVTANKLANMVWMVMSKGIAFVDPGVDSYNKKYRERTAKSAVRKLVSLGYAVSIADPPTADVRPAVAAT